MKSSLAERHCAPSHRGDPKLPPERVTALLHELDGWRVEADRLRKTFKLADFANAMQFLNRVAEVAEAEQHHPDFAVHYNEVDFTIWTHVVGGLSENDFILAAKIDGASSQRQAR